jgi:predicted DNA-binding protein
MDKIPKDTSMVRMDKELRDRMKADARKHGRTFRYALDAACEAYLKKSGAK